MENKTTKFLKYSIILTSLLCVVTFTLIGTHMDSRSAKTIQEVGTIYMSGMNEQITLHFETIIDMELSQIEEMVEANPVRADGTVPLDDLAYEAKARGFEYLALYSQEGSFEMIYGNPLKVTKPQPFLDSLNNNEKKVAVGTDADGKKVILLGISVTYPMSDGVKGTALVAGLPAEYMKSILFLEREGAMVTSFIIRTDGEFVIRNSDGLWDNYFTRIRTLYEGTNGKTKEQLAQELQDAMNNGKGYSAVFEMEGKRRHMYCTSLPNSEWYLITVLPYGALNEAVSNLSHACVWLAVGGCVIVLSALLFVFFKYFHISQHQMKELEKAREKAVKATKAKSEFLSNMSHDIRTPMNAIVGMTAIAITNIDNRDQVQNCLKKITLSSRHLLGLINDILDMSKIESGKLTLNMDMISLKDIIEGIVGIVQPQVKTKKQTFDVLINDISVENVCCDGVRLNQVLLNFLSNAIKFTPEGGTIRLSLSEEASPKGEHYIRTHIEVKDSGIGMSKEFLDKIYESYTREDSRRVQKTEGAGLGMAITKYIVDAMGGTIDVWSEPGKGTKFHVVLDLEKADIQGEEMILPDWKMLVVDDDQQLCEAAIDSLKSIGVKADWTQDGESAVDIVSRHRESGDDYQIILLDWKLPGMDGIQTAQAIRSKLGGDIPILLISAYDWSDIEQKAREAGINGFIAKPLFKSTLFYGLKKYMVHDSEEPQPEEQRTDFSGKRILMAEDNELNWEIAEEILSEMGLEMEWAEDGRICVDKFGQSPAGYYDLILMDLRMPVMSGYEATEAIRKLDRPDADIPIIAMTADAFAEDIQHCLACGMNAHVAKPIDIKAVTRLLEKYL